METSAFSCPTGIKDPNETGFVIRKALVIVASCFLPLPVHWNIESDSTNDVAWLEKNREHAEHLQLHQQVVKRS